MLKTITSYQISLTAAVWICIIAIKLLILVFKSYSDAHLIRVYTQHIQSSVSTWKSIGWWRATYKLHLTLILQPCPMHCMVDCPVDPSNVSTSVLKRKLLYFKPANTFTLFLVFVTSRSQCLDHIGPFQSSVLSVLPECVYGCILCSTQHTHTCITHEIKSLSSSNKLPTALRAMSTC